MKLIVQNDAHTIGIATIDSSDEFIPMLIVGVDTLKELLAMLKTIEGSEYHIGVARANGSPLLGFKPVDSPGGDAIIVVAPKRVSEEPPASKEAKAKADPAQKALSGVEV